MAILAATAGATDAISFLGLGGVFSSVMTANMVLLGLGAGQQDGPLALRAGAALTGYIVGALAASRLTGPAARPGNGWPTPVFAALVAEGIVLAGITVGWEIAPAGQAVARRLRLLAMLIAGAIASGVTYTQAPRLAPLIPLTLLAGVIGIAASTRTSRAGGRGDPADNDRRTG